MKRWKGHKTSIQATEFKDGKAVQKAAFVKDGKVWLRITEELLKQLYHGGRMDADNGLFMYDIELNEYGTPCAMGTPFVGFENELPAGDQDVMTNIRHAVYIARGIRSFIEAYKVPVGIDAWLDDEEDHKINPLDGIDFDEVPEPLEVGKPAKGF